MNIELFSVIFFALFMLLLFLGFPVAFVTGGTAAILALIYWGPSIFLLIVLRTWDQMISYAFIAAPMFVFMAVILEKSGVAEDLYKSMLLWMGRIRGGLAITTVITCLIISAMVGIIGAGVVMMGIIALPQMLNRGYNKYLATGTIMAGGCLGILIPPSIMLVIYGMVAGIPVSDLFAGAVMPGLLLGFLYIVYIAVRCYLQPNYGPGLPSDVPQPKILEKVRSLKGLVIPTTLIVLVLGSIFAGIATPTEAAGVGAFGAVLAAALRKKLTLTALKETALQTVSITAMIMWIIFGASGMTTVYTLAGGLRYMEQIVGSLEFDPWVIMILIQILLIVMGLMLDWLPILVLVGPVMIPLIKNLGFDPLWFGILFVLNMQLSFLSPPFAPPMYYLKSVTPPNITMTDLNWAVFPFLGLQAIGLILCMVFPEIITWLPSILYK
ncbi:MAG: TRAP transporter large permease subunit [Thermodesulfobacteriota bacterium]|nr:TRAP transporter large permease subunit [Thermodesulfobacteriota bacterium]